MKWHILMILFGSLMLLNSIMADELDIPDDILDEELEDDEDILRILEEKKIVSLSMFLHIYKVFTTTQFIYL